jgi:hypothetical protein
MGFRLSLLVFSASVCILTGASLGVAVYQEVQYIWAYPILAFAWIFAFAFAFDHLLSNQRLNRRKLLVLIFGLIIASSGVTHAVWVIGTPKWSFTVSTDKSIYALTEDIHITVTLTNLGYIPHSFPSIVDPPVIVDVRNTYYIAGNPEPDIQMWYTAILNLSQTTLTIPPGQSLTRTFVWNQTVIYPESSLGVTPGTYVVDAFVPDPRVYPSLSSYLPPFWATIYINITATS